MCKVKLHLLLHLKDNVQQYGPLVNCSQFYVERYIGFIKNRLNSRTLAAEALCENAKLFENYKLLFDEHFVRSETRGFPKSDSESSDEEDVEEGGSGDDCILLAPKRYECLESPHNKSMKLRKLLKANIRAGRGLSDAEAENAMNEEVLLSAGMVKVRCGSGWQVIGTGISGFRSMAGRSRADFYVAAEFLS